MLRKGILARAEDPMKIAAYNAYCGDPMKWFDNEYFRNNGLSSVTFDFFVDWEKRKIPKRLWTKRIIYRPFSMECDEIYRKIVAVDGRDGLETLLGFCRQNQFELEYLLCPDIPAGAWADPENHLFLFNMTKYLERCPGKEVLYEVSANQLKGIIRGLRRESHAIGRKGLQYASSSLEVYLSRDDYIYPGDADIVLVDENAKAKAVIEVKKHTIFSEKKYGPVEGETLYHYRDTDKLKFQSLGILKETLGCPLYMLYYSTVPNREGGIVKMERIVGSPDRLLAVYPYTLKLPEVNNSHSLKAFQENFLDYHNEICRYDFDRICLTSSYGAGTAVSKAAGGNLNYILDARNHAPEKDVVRAFREFVAGHVPGL